MIKPEIDIFIGYDNRLFYDALANLISSKDSYNVLGGIENGENVLEKLKLNRADIILIELEFPNTKSIKYLEKLHAEFPDRKILLVAPICNNGNTSTVIDTGINAFILKKCNREDLFNAIDHVAENKKYFCSNITQHLLKEYHSLKDTDKQLLSQREIEILKKLVNGNSNKKISIELGISESTVKTHRKNLMGKIGAYNQISLVRYACRNNLIEFGADTFCLSCPYK